MDTDEEQIKLLEAITLVRDRVPATSPPFNGFGPRPQYWNWYGGPYPINARQNPKGLMDIEYHNTDGKRHRLSGPAYVSELYNVSEWYKEGKRHRVGGPAYVHNNTMIWYYEGELHRLDGPAVIEYAGPKQYWIHGQRYSPKEYKKEIARRKRKGLIK